MHQSARVAQQHRRREGERLRHLERGAQVPSHREPGRLAGHGHALGQATAVREPAQQAVPRRPGEQVGARVDDAGRGDGIEGQGRHPGERPDIDDVTGHRHDAVGTTGRLRQHRSRRAGCPAAPGPDDDLHRRPGLERGLVLDGPVGGRRVGQRQRAHRHGEQHEQHGADLPGQAPGELPPAPGRFEPARLSGDAGDLAGQHGQQPQAQDRQARDDDGRGSRRERVDRGRAGRVVAAQLHDREHPEADEQQVEPRAGEQAHDPARLARAGAVTHPAHAQRRHDDDDGREHGHRPERPPQRGGGQRGVHAVVAEVEPGRAGHGRREQRRQEHGTHGAEQDDEQGIGQGQRGQLSGGRTAGAHQPGLAVAQRRQQGRGDDEGCRAEHDEQHRGREQGDAHALADQGRRVEQLGQPRADPGVAQGWATDRAVRVGSAVGEDAGRVPQGVDDLLDVGPGRGEVVGGDVAPAREPSPGRGRRPRERAVEGPLGGHEGAVGREVGAGDPRHPQRVVDPQAVLDPGRPVGAGDDDRQRLRVGDEVGQRQTRAHGDVERLRGGHRQRHLEWRATGPDVVARRGRPRTSGEPGATREVGDVGEHGAVGRVPTLDPPRGDRGGAGHDGIRPARCHRGPHPPVDVGELAGTHPGHEGHRALLARDVEGGAHAGVGDGRREQLQGGDDDHRHQHRCRHGHEGHRVGEQAPSQQGAHAHAALPLSLTDRPGHPSQRACTDGARSRDVPRS